MGMGIFFLRETIRFLIDVGTIHRAADFYIQSDHSYVATATTEVVTTITVNGSNGCNFKCPCSLTEMTYS